MDELIEKISQMNSAELQRFCELDENKDEPDALALEAYSIEVIYRKLDSKTFGVENEGTPTEKILLQCVEAMDIATTVEMILTLRDEDSE